ncbi:MAG: helix-turn-helix domain containing protein [Bacteroidales bacterium]|nr:helix-turn-helix domain containing protein [Bacteroidales bacterium]
MSRRRAYSPEALATIGRFFDALDNCIAIGRIKSESHFCESHSIDRRAFYHQRKDHGREFFEAGWLTFLVQECGVSAHWLLTGEGLMFEK